MNWRKKLTVVFQGGAFEKFTHFTFHWNSINVSLVDHWMQIDGNPILVFSAFANLCLSLIFLSFCSQACCNVFHSSRKRALEASRLVTTTAQPLMAQPSMLSEKWGWSSWKNTWAKVRRSSWRSSDGTDIPCSFGICDYNPRKHCTCFLQDVQKLYALKDIRVLWGIININN